MSNDDIDQGPQLGLADPDHDPAHARLRTALGETGGSLAPKAGWEARVWERIEAEERGAARVRWGWFASGAMAAAAAVTLLVWQPWRGEPVRSPGVDHKLAMVAPTITIRAGEQVMRSDAAAPGSILSVHHGQQAPANVVVWVYYDEQLVHEGGAKVEMVLDRPGTYHVISTVGPRPAHADLDAALAALVTDGVKHQRKEIVVR